MNKAARLHRMLVWSAALLGAGAVAMETNGGVSVSSLAGEISREVDHIDALDLADRLIQSPSGTLVFDLRSEREYAEQHIPTATHATLENLARMSLPRNKTIVLYSEGGGHAAQAWVLLRLRGYSNVFFLREGIYEWMARVDQPRLAVDASDKETLEFQRAAKLSRFFGGTSLTGVPRTDVPVGYWTMETRATDSTTVAPPERKKIRRRGC